MAGLKLGSLFDGSGGFPLAGVINGIEPVWASEIEPYPIRVTTARFPHMKHLGDVTKIDGATIEPVDIITFGSPCQDLSVAGKQAGIHDGERSNLFFEAIRIIKEMRIHDELDGRTGLDIRPRFAVWENVPGAFSSNKGEDFRAVLEAFAGVCENGLSIPRPQKWNHAGCVVGNGWSVAWRVYDAQYWGVPQRRKRIYLVADFGSERAGEILFERESVCRDTAQSGAEREGTATDAEGSIGRSCGVRCYNESGVGYWMPGFGCLRAEGENRPSRPTHCVVKNNGVRCLNPWDSESKRVFDVNGAMHTLYSHENSGRHTNGICYPAAFMGGQGAKAGSIGYCNDGTTPTLKASPSGGNTVPDVCYALQGNGIDRADTAGCYRASGYGDMVEGVGTLRTNGGDVGEVRKASSLSVFDARGNGDGQTVPTLTGDHQNRATDYTSLFCFKSFGEHTPGNVKKTLACRDNSGACDVLVQNGHTKRKYIVRRLTPLECCRLQGFPDWWTDGVDGSDSAKYKMWGNGIALPCAVDVLRRIVEAVE